MNGLANAILTLLLSWLRVIINRFWSLINSETGTSFQQFLSKNWPTILIVLLVGGYLLDRIIYLIRWRPFQVWLRRRKGKAQQPEADMPRYSPAEAQAAGNQPYFDPYQPPHNAGEEEPYAGAVAYSRKDTAVPERTAVYAHSAATRSAYMPPIENVNPVFDEEQPMWAESDPLVAAPSHTRTTPPVSEEYIQDMKAGFARPLSPEQYYAPQPTWIEPPVYGEYEADAEPVFTHSLPSGQPYASQPTRTDSPVYSEYDVADEPVFAEPIFTQPLPYAPPIPEPEYPGIHSASAAQPVHPGLDPDALRRNMGLTQAPDQPEPDLPGEEEAFLTEPPIVTEFIPFSQMPKQKEEQKKSRNPFLNLMRFVGDDGARRSIHDLRQTVDVREAFHEPVFPVQNDPDEEA